MEILSYPVGLLIGLFPVIVSLGDQPAPAKLLLDGAPVCTVTRAAPACTVDLGPDPRIHLLELVRRDDVGRITEKVRRWVNKPGVEAEVRATGDCDEKSRVCDFALSWAHPARLDPSAMSVTLDGTPVSRSVVTRIHVPFPNAARPQVFTVDATFEDGRRASFTQALELNYPERAEASLQAVPIQLAKGANADGLSEMLSRSGWRPRAVEEGGYEVLFVVEPDALDWLPGLGQSAAQGFAAFVSVLDDAEQVQIIVADDSITAMDAFGTAPARPTTNRFGQRITARSYWLRRLIQAPHSVGRVKRMRTADAVALAGYALGGAPRRRIVVLIAGAESADESSLSAAQAQAYLSESLVPLSVWRTRKEAAPGWPDGPFLRRPGDFAVALARAKADLASQRLVWLEGVNDTRAFRPPLPQGISIAGRLASEGAVTGTDPEEREPSGNGALENFVYANVLSPLDPRTLYAGTRAGLRISRDGAATWSRVAFRKETADVYALAPAEASDIFVGASGSLARSLAGGESWSFFPALAVFGVAADPFDPRTAFAATRQGVVKTMDGGLHWKDASSGLSNTFALSIAASPAERGVLYAATAGRGIFKTTDAGERWKSAARELDRTLIRCVAVDPAEPATVYGGTDGGVLVSRDSGATWTFHHAGLPRSSVYALAPLGPAGVLAAGTSRGLFLSRDHGLTWRAVDEASRLPPITSIAVSREGKELFAGTLGAGVVRVPLPPE
ncbi:MAG: hypothetical protein M3167_17185 [Acidobacteriota bacterium]|nr:hypothetical protein [Acidobacteriota bacterium]